MNALTFEQNSTKEPNTVSQIIKPGYILNKRVIRPADVVVVKAPPTPEAEQKQEEAPKSTQT